MSLHTEIISFNSPQLVDGKYVYAAPTTQIRDGYTSLALKIAFARGDALSGDNFFAYYLDKYGYWSTFAYDHIENEIDKSYSITQVVFDSICTNGMKLKRIGDVAFSLSTAIVATYPYEDLIINNLNVSGTIDSGLSVSWAITSGTQTAFTACIKNGATVVATKTGTTAQYCNFSYAELPAPGTYTVEVTVQDMSSQPYRQGVVSTIASLTMEELSISNFSVTGTNLDSTLAFTWSQTINTEGWTIQAYLADVLKGTYTGTTADFSLPPAFSDEGTYRFVITATKKGTVATAETTIRLSKVNVSIATASLTSTNIEKGSSITASATGANISGVRVDILDSNSNLVFQNTSATFSTLSLSSGSYKAKVIAYHTNGHYETTDNEIINFTVFSYDAEITSVWPNSTRELRKSNIQLGFSAKNFTSYSISAIQGNVTKYTKTGTNTSEIDKVVSKTIDLVNSLFDQGEASITVSVTNARSSYSTDDSMTVKFTVIDNPNTPTLTYDQDYSTPKPTIYCACSSAYVSYIIAIDGIEGSEIFGNISQYYFETALENNAYHTFKLKVKNTYGLWSEWATASFYVSYAELNTPEFSVYTDVNNGCICVAMESTDEENFRYNSVLRLENGTWVEIGKELERVYTFIDNSCASGKEYSYKVRAYDIFGGYKDTSTTTCVIEFTGTILSVPWTNQKLKLQYFNSEDDVTKNIANNISDTYVEVCGLSLPKLQKGTLKGRSLQLNVAFKTKQAYDVFMSFIGNDTLLFRDGKGVKMYCHITISNEKDYLRYYKCVTANIKEIYYKEGDFIEIPDKPFIWNVEEY